MDSPIHILVAEDDSDISRLLCSIIKKSGYTPQPAFSGTEALLYLEQRRWSLVLLDLMLPGMPGEELLERIRLMADTPVVVISAKAEQRTKVSALRGGADDFITKPFDIEEVSARIDSHLRRYARIAQPVMPGLLRHKGLMLDRSMNSAAADGTELALTVREYEILALLLSAPTKVFTKANLYESAWNEPFYGDVNTINVHMSNLRSKLAKAAPGSDFIETVWGIGYRLKP
ncbi:MULTISPECIES: response regulator transcription factor [unclassified Paenibacillus]|uniref:response regulator transcription factor n=1 Tax=unclassified Paenibacillus TaxID=185978 RepID=UPI0009569281|nr:MULTISPECIES: response regulator transcription factor [unclassified Paenibacillus]ASS67767.1 response regulator transcription factor [Paenibacillus sp. RUD330]SIR61186.1 DNA-binding response regulator, OmpR family, contains REC and winged-helix (wHTH) domain [Paenibacillus sp. RU4X]SIR69820.1 DNA-binding response regulator, OmpR family, contains REC and winged-helix (wHTH) domain [Paenibacillus sp. RU4T]